jgi:hypothetical protein
VASSSPDPAAGILVLSQPTPPPKSPQRMATQRTSPTSHVEPLSEDDEKAAAEYLGSYLYGLTLKNEWKDLKFAANHLIRVSSSSSARWLLARYSAPPAHLGCVYGYVLCAPQRRLLLLCRRYEVARTRTQHPDIRMWLSRYAGCFSSSARIARRC